jgi:O-antigen/teichoic acid export membrane protein
MSRRQKALVNAAFTYAQWLVGALSSFYVTRFMLHTLGEDRYGMWLATGALILYSGLADLGILAVMPWLFAEADGAKDAERTKSLIAHGVAAALLSGLGSLIVAFALWAFLPRLLHFSPADQGLLRGPVFAMAGVTAITYPLRVFIAFRTGLQDYVFLGRCGVVQTLLGPALIIGLTWAVGGFYGIALGGVLAQIVVGVAALARSAVVNPEVFRAWPRPDGPLIRYILTSGAGAWLATLGFQLAAATDNALVAYLGRRDLVPTFVITSRLGLTLMQMSWALPDSAYVGLAQLNAEEKGKKGGRVAEVIMALLRLQLLAAGALACCLLAGNYGFVSAWVGPGLFGGVWLNAMFALAVISLSIAHGLIYPTGVLGKRLYSGGITLANGLAHIGLAVVLGRAWGLSGVAAATTISALLTTIPFGALATASLTGLRIRRVVAEVFVPWAARMVPTAFIGAAAGWAVRRPVFASAGRGGAFVLGLVAAAVVGVVYLVVMRSLTRGLPVPPRVRGVLERLRLV